MLANAVTACVPLVAVSVTTLVPVAIAKLAPVVVQELIDRDEAGIFIPPVVSGICNLTALDEAPETVVLNVRLLARSDDVTSDVLLNMSMPALSVQFVPS